MASGKPSSGECENMLDPVGYGFEVIPVTVPEYEEARAAVAALYRRARARTGLDIPALDHFLADQPYDPAPARTLLAKHEALTYPDPCDFGRADLEIDEGVFDPTLTNVSLFMLEHVDFRPGERMLDAFAGSGAFGVSAALRGNRVVSFDNSLRAVACAQKNAARNHVENIMEVRHGTLKQAVHAGETFDLIVANPPLVAGESVGSPAGALFDSGMRATIEFVQALPTMLNRKGRCYLLTSDVIDRHAYKLDIAELCRRNGLKISTVAQLHKEYESYRVHRIRRRILPMAPLLQALSV